MFWQRLKGRGVGRLYSGEKGRLWACPDQRLLAWGSWKWANEAGILCDLLGVHIRLSLMGPKLQAETKIREARPGRLGKIVAGVTVWLPGLFLEIAI